MNNPVPFTCNYYLYEDINNYILEKIGDVDLEMPSHEGLWDVWLDCVYEDVSNGKIIRVFLSMVLSRLTEDYMIEKYGEKATLILFQIIQELKTKLDSEDDGIWVEYSW